MTSTTPIDTPWRIQRRTYTTPEMVRALNAWHLEHHATPTRAAWEATHPAGTPCASAIADRWRGSWTAAILAAGLEPNTVGRKKRASCG